MNIVLVRCAEGFVPRETNVTGCYPPLGLAYLAAVLREAGFTPRIIDAEAEGWGLERVVEAIPADAGIVGFTGTTLLWPTVREVAARVRRARPNALLVIGGAQVTAFPEATLEGSVFDLGILGDGEQALVEIARRRANGGDYRGVPGCVVRDPEGHPRQTGPVAWIDDLDSLPLPALDLLPMHRYRSVMVTDPFVSIVTSRGCPYRCRFCSQIYGGDRLRTHSPERIVAEMERAVRKYGARELVLFDETFGVRREDALRVCALIRECGLAFRWSARTRVNVLDEELLVALRDAGCYALHLGVESGSDRILEAMNKNITVAQVRDAVALARRLGFRLHAYFMIGYPGETRAEIAQTLKLSRELPLDWASYTITIPNPRTPLCDLAVERGMLAPDYWRDYTLGNAEPAIPFFTSEECSAAYLKRTKRMAYLRFYLRPCVAARNLVFFVSTGGWGRLLTAFRLWLREERL